MNEWKKEKNIFRENFKISEAGSETILRAK